jgi:hypothetical protein
MFDMVGGKEGIAKEVGLVLEDLAPDLMVGDVQDQNLIHGGLVPSVLGPDMGGGCPLIVVLAGVVIAMVVHVRQSTVVTVTNKVKRGIADIEKNPLDITQLKTKGQNG